MSSYDKDETHCIVTETGVCQVEDGIFPLIKKLQESNIENELSYQSNIFKTWKINFYSKNEESHSCNLIT